MIPIVLEGLFMLVILVVIGVAIFGSLCWIWDEYWLWRTIKEAIRLDKLDEEYVIWRDEEDHKENEDKNYLNRIGVCDDY